MKVFTLNRLPDGCGAYSEYYRLSKRTGVKVLAIFSSEHIRSIAALKRSHEWKQAVSEAALLRKAYKSNIVPKCYGVVIIRQRSCEYWEYSPGIIMQHLEGVQLATYVYKRKITEQLVDDILSKLKSRLRACDLNLLDLHDQNVIVTGKQKKKFWVIDFTPDYIEEVRRRKKGKNG